MHTHKHTHTNHTIHCPECKASIDVSEVLREQLKKELNDTLQREQSALQKEREALQQEQQTIESHRRAFEQKQAELAKSKAEMEQRIRQKENDLQRKFEDDLNDRVRKEKQSLENELEEKLRKEKVDLQNKLRQELSASIESENKAYIEELQKKLQSKTSEVNEMRKLQLELETLKLERGKHEEAIELAKQQAVIEARKQERLAQQEMLKKQHEAEQLRMENEKQKHDRELSSVKSQLETLLEQQALQEQDRSNKLRQEFEQRLRQEQDKLAGVMKELEDAKRKAEQGSMQLQGEVQEEIIQEWMEKTFPMDTVKPIAKGQKGADIIIDVVHRGTPCGSICIESKKTKTFDEKWINKLREDMQREGCSWGILVTETMPKGKKEMYVVGENIWVCTLPEFKVLLSAVREMVLRIHFAKTAHEGKEYKAKELYEYIISDEFIAHLSAIARSYSTMLDDLNKERTVMEKSWSKRQKLIEVIRQRSANMHGSLDAIVQGKLAKNDEILELDGVNEELESRLLE